MNYNRDNNHNRERKEKPDFIFGLRAIIEAIESGKSIDRVLIRKDLSGGDLARELNAKIKEYGIVSQRVPVEKLNRITMKNHQGAVAFISPVSYQPLDEVITSLYEEGKVPLLLLLDGVTDTRNFGAIARTADCAGFDAIVIPERGSATVTPEAIKTSAGALFYLPVCRVRSIRSAVDLLKSNGIKVTGASEKASAGYTTMDFSVPSAIVMGAEDTGISDDVLKACDELAAIPILGSIGSLNVSVAAGVMMYEAVSQRMKVLQHK